MPRQFNDKFVQIRFHPSLVSEPNWMTSSQHMFRWHTFIQNKRHSSNGFIYTNRKQLIGRVCFNNRWSISLFLCLPLCSCSSLNLSLLSLLSLSPSVLHSPVAFHSLSLSLPFRLFPHLSVSLTGCHSQPKRRYRKTIAKIYILYIRNITQMPQHVFGVCLFLSFLFQHHIILESNETDV